MRPLKILTILLLALLATTTTSYGQKPIERPTRTTPTPVSRPNTNRGNSELQRREEEIKRREEDIQRREAELQAAEEQQRAAEARRQAEEADALRRQRENTVYWDDATSQVCYNDHRYKMVKVDGGTFHMGATGVLASEASTDERPIRSVTLTPYWIGETEVPQWLWMAVMGNNPSAWKGDNLPVEQVSWNDCQEFVSQLTRLTGKAFAIPTEAQWEYAARGANMSGNTKYSGSANIFDVARHEGNSSNCTHEVKTKSPNEIGLYDMSGNVWEWCYDWYNKSYPQYSETNPIGPGTGTSRVNRGGGYRSTAKGCRVSNRGSNPPKFKGNNLGMRLALMQ